jgi:hypothetical protein
MCLRGKYESVEDSEEGMKYAREVDEFGWDKTASVALTYHSKFPLYAHSCEYVYTKFGGTFQFPFSIGFTIRR